MTGDRIKELRVEYGYTQDSLGKKLGKGGSTVRMWELGKNAPDGDTLVALAELFDVTVDYLLGRTDVRKPTLPSDVKDIAFHLTVDELTDEGKQQVLDYIEFLKKKYKKNS